MSSNKDFITKMPIPEVITPHKIAIAILIKNYCNFRDSDEFKTMETDNLKAKYRRDFCVLILKLLQCPDLSLLELRNILVSEKYNVSETLIRSFDETISDLYKNGIGTMLDVIDLSLNRVIPFNSNSSLQPTDKVNCFVSKSSVVGYYIRRLIVNFEDLTFSEVTGVFKAFQHYYEKWQKNKVSQQAINHTDDWSANREQWSRKQAELFIATQAALLSNNEEKALPPNELQNRIRNLLKSNPSLSEAHFLSYLNYLRVKEFCGAIDSLYHSFDRRTVIDIKANNEERSKVYRFAALNLAVLHYHFGHLEEALAALKEAIKISQAVNDNICLQHALSWLYHMTEKNKEKLIIHSISKSCDLELSYTMSLGIQNFVQYASLLSGNPHHIFEALTKSDIINCQHNLKDLISNSYAVKSCLWQYYGKSEMCSLWSQLLFYLNTDNPTAIKAFYGEGFCLAICNVSNYLLMQGNYELVYTVLNFAKEKFPNEPNCYIWMLCENLFVFTRSLHHENWNEAESAVQKIMVIDKWEGYLRMAEFNFYKSDFIEAQNCIDVIIEQCQSTHHIIRAKILRAEIQYASSFPDKCVAGIINLLTNCLIETNKNHMDYITAIITLHIAHIHLLLGISEQALKILDRCLIQILSHGGIFDRARAVLLYVKCLVANSVKFNEEKRTNTILNAVQTLDKVKENFRKVEAFSRVKDVLYLQAQLYNSVNKRSERNKCASEFRKMEEEHVTKNYYTLVKYL